MIIIPTAHSLVSCETDLYLIASIGTIKAAQYTAVDNDGRAVRILDTPGFGDTTRSDTKILEEIAGQLAELYNNKYRLLGVIFLHRITDIRLSRSALRSFNILQELCGPDCYDRIILATTMWSDAKSAAEGLQTAEARHEHLKNDYWNKLFDGKSQVIRHENTSESAWYIVRHLQAANDKDNTGVRLKIQSELVEERLGLAETGAGLYIQQEALQIMGSRGVADGEHSDAQRNRQQDDQPHGWQFWDLLCGGSWSEPRTPDAHSLWERAGGWLWRLVVRIWDGPKSWSQTNESQIAF